MASKSKRDNVLDSSDEEEGLDQYEEDGFLVDDVDEEEDDQPDEPTPASSSSSSRKKKSKRKRKRPRGLDLEDIQLLHDNLGFSSVADDDRPSKYKRLKRTAPADGPGRSARDDYLLDVGSPDPYARSPSPPPAARRRRSEEADARQRVQRANEDIFGELGDYEEYADESDDEPGLTGLEELKDTAQLSALYEPVELEESFLTEKDEAIRQRDCPERLQDRRSTPTESELQQEAEWIAARLPEKGHRAGDDLLITSIFQVLQSMRVEHNEMPYIATYQRDLYALDFQPHELYDIEELDSKWSRFYTYREHLQALIEATPSLHAADPDYFAFLRSATSEEDLSDIHTCFSLYHPDARPPTAGGPLRPERRSFYHDCVKAGVSPLVRQYGLLAKQLGENLHSNFLAFPVEDCDELPEDAAIGCLSPAFSTSEMVMKAARYVMASEIAADLNVKTYVRNRFFERGVLCTVPTPAGKVGLSEDSPLYAVKRLADKPLLLIQREGQMPLIFKALDDKMITARILLPEAIAENLRMDMENLFLSTGVSEAAVRWNKERQTALKIALDKHLLPQMERELFKYYAHEVQDSIRRRCMQAFRGIIRYGPFGGKQRCVISLVWGTDSPKEPVIATAVDRDGRFMDSMRLDDMACMSSRDKGRDDLLIHTIEQSVRVNRKHKNTDDLKAFIIKHRPAVIVVGANCMHARQLREDIDDIIRDMQNVYTSVASVVWGSTTVPQICSATAEYEREFPNSTALRRCGVSLARMLQDPLPQLALLFNKQMDVASLSLHPMQRLLPKPILTAHLARVFVEQVNRVGLDINRTLDTTYMFPTLRYICGLGPRKADALRLKLIQEKEIPVMTRQRLIDLQSPVVARNMVGFVRVTPDYTSEMEYELNMLDATRIHPDHYDAARLIMSAVVRQLTGGRDEDNVEQAFEGLLEEDEHRIARALQNDIDFQHDRELSRIPSWVKDYIIPELLHRFRDPRDVYVEPTPDELFTLLTGETDSTLAEGQLVTGVVFTVLPKEGLVKVKLGCGLIAIIDQEHVSDVGVQFLRDHFVPRQSVQCRVMRVDKTNLTVELSCRPSDLTRPSTATHDPYWQPEPAPTRYSSSSSGNTGAMTPSRSSGQKKRPKVQKRMIDHPLFKNITFMEAEELLEEAESGELVFRPSSKGTDHLTLTYKFHDECVHVDILEEDKPSLNKLQLGRRLLIRNEAYEDLGHIEAHYLEPIIVFTQKMARFRHFASKSQQDIQEDLLDTKKKDPRSIPYKIGVSTDYPGRYVLYYVPNKSIRKEYISVLPTGFKFRSKMFTSVNELVDWFKKNWKNTPSRGSSSSASAAAAPRSSYATSAAPPPPVRTMVDRPHGPPGGGHGAPGLNRPSYSQPPGALAGATWSTPGSEHASRTSTPREVGSGWTTTPSSVAGSDAGGWQGDAYPASQDNSPWTSEWNRNY